jgi:CheY-like chemotaxis protein
MSDQARRDSVLVIDDNADFRELIAMIGELCGVPVLQASDCSSALRVLNRELPRIKLIFLDYYMPGMEPITCAHAITEKAGPSVPVVLLTAAMNPSTRAQELHLDRWIAKPVDPSTLKEIMSQPALAINE